jgi:hypothetical protein
MPTSDSTISPAAPAPTSSTPAASATSYGDGEMKKLLLATVALTALVAAPAGRIIGNMEPGGICKPSAKIGYMSRNRYGDDLRISRGSDRH